MNYETFFGTYQGVAHQKISEVANAGEGAAPHADESTQHLGEFHNLYMRPKFRLCRVEKRSEDFDAH